MFQEFCAFDNEDDEETGGYVGAIDYEVPESDDDD
jgi:hypothetical protein